MPIAESAALQEETGDQKDPLAAAVRWTFEPARADHLAVSSRVILHFRFAP